MSHLKKDYRKGFSPRRRTTECQKAIRNALRQGKKTFGNLLDETGLGRPTLAFHLKEMHKKGELRRETDPKDYRITYYSLTNKGRDELHRQDDIETITLGSIVVKRVGGQSASGLSYLEDAEVLRCIAYSVYSSQRLKTTEKNFVKVLAHEAAVSILDRFARGDAMSRFKKIPNLTFIFRLGSETENN